MLTEEEILTLVRDKVDHPATARELLHVLRVPREERATFKRRLRALVASGALVVFRGNLFGLPDRMNLVVGRVATNPRGFGFVEPEATDPDGPGSIFIAGNNLNQAMHGDRVVVRVERQRNGDRAEGRILRILEHFIGPGSPALVMHLDRIRELLPAESCRSSIRRRLAPRDFCDPRLEARGRARAISTACDRLPSADEHVLHDVPFVALKHATRS